MSSLDDFSFSIDDNKPHQRGAYRAAVRGLQVTVEGEETPFNVCDISATGCSLQCPQDKFQAGRMLSMRLEARGVIIVRGITAKVVRFCPDGSVACAFQRLNRTQEVAVDKLVLEIQKTLISQKKAEPNASAR